METISLYDIVTENGLNISFDNLKDFLNQKVKIVVSPLDEIEQRKERLRQLAGCISDDDAKEILNAIQDCKKISIEDWDEVFT